jgi:hypothetical protein
MLNKNQHTHKDVLLPLDTLTKNKKLANHHHRFADNDRVLGKNNLSIPLVTIPVISKKIMNLYWIQTSDIFYLDFIFFNNECFDIWQPINTW